MKPREIDASLLRVARYVRLPRSALDVCSLRILPKQHGAIRQARTVDHHSARMNAPRMEGAMLFFVWYDDSPKKQTGDKLQEAIAAYIERFRTRPTLVLMNTVDQLERTDITVRSERTVQPNTFWLGHEDHADLASA